MTPEHLGLVTLAIFTLLAFLATTYLAHRHGYEKGHNTTQTPAPAELECFHTWAPWTTIRKGRIANGWASLPTGTFIEQQRECTTCGLLELKEHRV